MMFLYRREWRPHDEVRQRRIESARMHRAKHILVSPAVSFPVLDGLIGEIAARLMDGVPILHRTSEPARPAAKLRYDAQKLEQMGRGAAHNGKGGIRRQPIRGIARREGERRKRGPHRV